jgi:uncharacterized lipoprotein YddW (UPF0748 family)
MCRRPRVLSLGLFAWMAGVGLLGCAGERPALVDSDEQQPIQEEAISPKENLPAEMTETTGIRDEPKPVSLPEVRGMWVVRWDYHSADEVKAIVSDAATAGVNQIYFQVRGEADAYYKSTLEPWALFLTGTLGKDPGWDPLAVAIEEAHARGIELHAWINVASAWRGQIPPKKSDPPHVLLSHPDWRVADDRGQFMPYSDGYVFLNLAHPDVQRHLEAVMVELAGSYSVDGIHLDYCRYPAANTSHDRVSNLRFLEAKKENPGLDRAKWQREELTGFVKRLSGRLKEVRPGLVVSAAVTGIYQNAWGWGGVQIGHKDFHQDSHLWAENAAVDALVPMIYWPPTDPPGERADFGTLVRDFASLKGKTRLLCGISVEAGDFSVLTKEIEMVRSNGYDGVVLFSWAGLKKRDWFGLLKETVFKETGKPICGLFSPPIFPGASSDARWPSSCAPLPGG